MESFINLLKLLGILPLFIIVLFSNFAFAGGLPTIDVTTNASVMKQTSETVKIVKASQGTLEKTEGILDQSQKINKALGDGATVGVDAFKWINKASGAANSALKACGIDGFIPSLSGIKIPGIDLPEFDLSCAKSAIDAVQETLFTYQKIKAGVGIEIGDGENDYATGSGEEAAKYNRPHYYATGVEDILKRHESYRHKTIKSALASANRTSSSSLSVSQVQTQLASLGNTPADLNDLMRISISVQLAQYQQQSELNAMMAKLLDMQAAQLMNQVPSEEIKEDE